MKDLLEALRTATHKDKDCYEVVCLGTLYSLSIAAGSKDYCYGYYNALDSSKYVIVCENVIIYPEDRFGEVIDNIE